jgi:hypothetical protein
MHKQHTRFNLALLGLSVDGDAYSPFHLKVPHLLFAVFDDKAARSTRPFRS